MRLRTDPHSHTKGTIVLEWVFKPIKRQHHQTGEIGVVRERDQVLWGMYDIDGCRSLQRQNILSPEFGDKAVYLFIVAFDALELGLSACPGI